MEQMNKPSRKRLIWVVLLALVLLIAGIGGVSAKYVKDFGGTDALVRAKEFYFSSDLLTENGAEYTLNPGTKEITFVLRNHDDQLRYSEDAVNYTVAVEGGGTVSPNNGSLSGNEINSTVTVTLSGLQDGESYTVTATGKAGYKKSLTATFSVAKPGENVYKHLDNSDLSGSYVLLTVWTENVSGEVTISFPAGLIPDATDPLLSDIQNYKDGKYQKAADGTAGDLEAYSSHTYRFFLEEPFAEFTADSFFVKVNGQEATKKIPE